MGDIERIEAARGGEFHFQLDGQTHTLPSPVGMGYQEILGRLQDSRRLTDIRMPQWRRDRVRDSWAARYDLPSFPHAHRLCYLVDRFAAPLTYALRSYAGVDLLELWHSRRWRTLLDLVDQLPAQSTFRVALASDEEYVEMMVEALARREPDENEPKGPSLASWTPEVDVLTSLRDDVRNLTYTVRAANGDRKAQPPKPLERPDDPMQRAMKRAEFKRRQAKHEALVARLLPHKR